MVLMINFIVRFAALVSFIALITNYSKSNTTLILMEVIMLMLWLSQDYKYMKRWFKK